MSTANSLYYEILFGKALYICICVARLIDSIKSVILLSTAPCELFCSSYSFKFSSPPLSYPLDVLAPQDGKVRLYSVSGNTLKDDEKVLEAKGPVTDMAYSNDGAFLAVSDEKKVVTVFTVADGYAVSALFGFFFVVAVLLLSYTYEFYS